ncbi:type III-A CRISPR-associated RAMP protein Csm3 [Methanocaldococcus sp. 10A]
MELPTLKGKLIISGNIITETGLHIGGISETLKIGGVDIQVIKDSLGRAYIPGSSLKGKIRSLLEIIEGNYTINIQLKKDINKNTNVEITINNGKIEKKNNEIKRKVVITSKFNSKDKKDYSLNVIKNEEMNKLKNIFKKYGFNENTEESKEDPNKVIFEREWNENIIKDLEELIDKLKENKFNVEKKSAMPCSCGFCEICKLFGPHNSKNILYPRRVIVRDAFLINEKTNEPLTKKDEDYDDYFEVKPENVIDRIKGTAQHPRQIERVRKGSKFSFEVIFNLYDKNDVDLIKKFIEGLKLLEDDYIGGCGSRGYGKIKFDKMNVIYKPIKYYEGKLSQEEINKDYKRKDIETLNNLKNKIEELLKIEPKQG